ncbi:hypothetical protein B0T19DRAFT_482845 [Cercophora scortea]|uniref:Uncharacterized protein n=1 Tax=Cercophora scortea TaxID=314031 RepID=A0AAE0IWJ3_9PEZI|nr:hypothetical protein B0T19DRAFT_482845 [Cercophora scortea]
MASQQLQQNKDDIEEKPPPAYYNITVNDQILDDENLVRGFPNSPRNSAVTHSFHRSEPTHVYNNSQEQPSAAVATIPSSFVPGWKKPLMRSTRTPGKPVPADFPYTISTYYCPVAYQSSNHVAARAPWIARAMFSFRDPERQLPRIFPWRGNMDRCWYDKMGIESHPLQHDVNVYVRSVTLAYQRCEGTVMDWSVCIDVWHRRPSWLECLSYADIEALIGPDTSVRVSGTMATTEDSLEHKQLFYIKFPKPNVHWVYKSRIHGIKEPLSSWDNRLDKLLGVDDPGLRRLVDKNMDRHIECVGQVLRA